MPIMLDQMYKQRSKGPNKILHGSDLPAKLKTINVVVVRVRVPPAGFNSGVICDIVPVLEHKISFPLNMTNSFAAGRFIGNDLEKLVGCTLTLTKVPADNPESGETTWGLSLTNVEKPTKKTLQAVANAAKAPVMGKPSNDNVPF